jgi:peptidoglycan/xylan/chitin deacetylase (PgdA/CDA1 family)
MYHAVWPTPANADALERRLFVHPDRFAVQMGYLAKRRYRALSLGEYAGILNGGPSGRDLLITFDDAYSHIDQVVTPVLDQYGFRAVLFAPWEHLGRRNNWDSQHPNLASLTIASRAQLIAMDDGPWEVASHGLRHVDLTRLRNADRRAQLVEARERLSDLLGRAVQDLSYPWGKHDASVREDALISGHRLAFATRFGNSHDPLQLTRRPIFGSDSMPIFRMKTTSWSDIFYRFPDLLSDRMKRKLGRWRSKG